MTIERDAGPVLDGLGVSLKDSYVDLAHQRRRPVPDWLLTGIVVLPPLLVALLNPGAFVHTLDIAGTFGGGLFVGILPVLILLKLRRSGQSHVAMTWGGGAFPGSCSSFMSLGCSTRSRNSPAHLSSRPCVGRRRRRCGSTSTKSYNRYGL